MNKIRRNLSLRRVLTVALLLASLLLAGCDPQIYAGMTVGSPWYSVGGINMGGSVSIGGYL